MNRDGIILLKIAGKKNREVELEMIRIQRHLEGGVCYLFDLGHFPAKFKWNVFLLSLIRLWK